MVAHHGTTYCAFFGRASESFQAASSPRVDSLYSSVLSVSTSNPRARRSRTANSHDSRSSSLDAPHCMSEALPGTHRYFCGSPLVSRSGNSLHNSAGLFSPARVAPPRNSLDYSLVVAPWQGRKSLADLCNEFPERDTRLPDQTGSLKVIEPQKQLLFAFRQSSNWCSATLHLELSLSLQRPT